MVLSAKRPKDIDIGNPPHSILQEYLIALQLYSTFASAFDWPAGIKVLRAKIYEMRTLTLLILHPEFTKWIDINVIIKN